MVLATGLQVYFHKCFCQKGLLHPLNCHLGQVIEDQDSSKIERAISLETRIDQIDTKINDLKEEIIRALRNDVENIGARHLQEIRRRIEHLEQGQINVSQ